MIENSPADFQSLCRTPEVETQIGLLEASRKSAVRKFWLILIAGGLGSALAFYSLEGWGEWGMILAGLLFVVVIILAIAPIVAVKEALKHPVLEALARQKGLEYLPGDFVPPAYASACPALFGRFITGETFSDLFNGTDGEGRGFALYEATLEKGSGRSRRQVFSGQVYALQRRTAAQGTTLIVPDRGIFNFFTPGRDMERVKFEDDANFEKRFEVYSTNPLEAKILLASSAVRRRLLTLRESGKLFAYFGAEEALIAVSGKDRFEPGNMFRSVAGADRVRLMFDDVCASLALLDELRTTFR